MINASQLVVRRGQRIVLENIDFSAGQGVTAVSYTHLTLPTNREV